MMLIGTLNIPNDTPSTTHKETTMHFKMNLLIPQDSILKVQHGHRK